MGVKLTALKFETIVKILGGAVGVKCDKEFRKAILDCEDAPRLKSAREVTLKVKFTPRLKQSRMSGEDEYAGCDVEFCVGGRIPSQAIVVAMTNSEQGLLFNPDAPEDPSQHTIEQED